MMAGGKRGSMQEEDDQERRAAELDFLQSAYEPHEVWWESQEHESIHVHRRLPLSHSNLFIVMTLGLPIGYPSTKPLNVVTACVDEGASIPSSDASGVNDKSTTIDKHTLKKIAYQALPSLLDSCRQVAEESIGQEALFAVLSQADEWLDESWPAELHKESIKSSDTKPSPPVVSTTHKIARYFVYSHHIISKTKRGDMKALAKENALTGYVKIGWPGLIVVEGLDHRCESFYKAIRRWNWKYLVLREIHTEELFAISSSAWRKFEILQETDDMSVVAKHCRKVGLEDEFLSALNMSTSKASSEPMEEQQEDNTTGPLFAALVHVDHMNDSSKYQKWLIKTSKETGTKITVLHCRRPEKEKEEMSAFREFKRAFIFVVVLGDDAASVSSVLKRWRTSRVDVNAMGKPCLERQMTVLFQGKTFLFENLDEVDLGPNQEFVQPEQLLLTVKGIGGEECEDEVSQIVC